MLSIALLQPFLPQTGFCPPALSDDSSSHAFRDPERPPHCPLGIAPLHPSSLGPHSPAEPGATHSGPSTPQGDLAPFPLSTSQEATPGPNPAGRGGLSQGNRNQRTHLHGHMQDRALCVLLGMSRAAGGELSARVSSPMLPMCSHESPEQPAIFFSFTLIKLPGSNPTSGFLSMCAICPYLSCFFPILSTRGSSRFKNGNERLGFFTCTYF